MDLKMAELNLSHGPEYMGQKVPPLLKEARSSGEAVKASIARCQRIGAEREEEEEEEWNPPSRREASTREPAIYREASVRTIYREASTREPSIARMRQGRGRHENI